MLAVTSFLVEIRAESPRPHFLRDLLTAHVEIVPQSRFIAPTGGSVLECESKVLAHYDSWPMVLSKVRSFLF